MRKRLLAIIVLFLSITLFSYGQSKKTAIIKGKLLNAATKTPFNDLKVTIPDLSVFTRSDGEGNFELSEIAYGHYLLVVSGVNAKTDSIVLDADKPIIDLKDIYITPNDKGVSIGDAEIPTISIAENGSAGSDPDNDGSQTGDELLLSSKDPFVSAAVHVFGPYLFRPRGMTGQNEIQINGIPFNNSLTNFLSWSAQLGDLNDVFQGRDVRYGLEPSPYTFGSANGATYIKATAADQQEETKISYTSTDRAYRNKIMLTKNSGLMKNGWAYSFSANKRWAQEAYVPGTYFDGYAYYAAVSKVINKSQFDLTTFGVPLTQSKASVSGNTQEVYDLAGSHYYNPDWGYDSVNGKNYVRSSHVQRIFQPTTILSYEYKPTDDTRWTTAAGYQFGKDRTSGLDDYNAASPYGNYYRNLPSFYLTSVPPDPTTAGIVRQQIMSNPALLQLNWNKMYADNETNTQTINDVNGIAGNSYTGKQSLYVLSDKVNDLKKFTFNTNFEHVQNPHKTLYGGLTVVSQHTEVYRQLTDLLGGDYFVNYNQFASQQPIANPSYNQNNLNDPNAIIKTGDKYGYDYLYRINNQLLWLQQVYTYDRVNWFLAANVGNSQFNREGFMKNGLFPNNSFGESDIQSFLNYAFKGGVTYNINRRNYLYLNAAYVTAPPTPDNTYIAPTIRDLTVSDPKVQRTSSIEGGYLLKSSKINARAVGYVNNTTNASQIKRFFNDDPAYYTFVNYAMQNENTRSIGTELMLDVKVFPFLNVTAVAAIGEAFYTNRPDINVYLDNDTTQHANPGKAYIKNYYLGVGPQSAYTLEFNYRPKNYWFVNLDLNYFDRNYVDINPNRRTQQAADLVQPGSVQWHQIFDQEELPGFFTADLHAGKSFQLSRMSKTIKRISPKTLLYVGLSVSNLLNNTNIIVRGYEQLRYDFTNENPAKFPNIYQYGYGRTYALNISLKF